MWEIVDSTERKLDKLFPESPELYKVKKTFLNILGYIHKQDWMGACHATTAVMYVMLNEQGYEVEACIGEVFKAPIIIDAAISNTLIQGLKFPPVFLSTDLVTEHETEFEYGCKTGPSIDPTADDISSMTIGTYMDNFPGHPQGLWGTAKELSKKQTLRFNVAKAKAKYGESKWVIKN